MKTDCRQFLEDYISNHIYGASADYDFYKLFKIYSTYEISCPQDMNRAIDEFYDFLIEFKQAIFKRKQDTPPTLIKYSAKALHMLLESPLTPLQEAFTQFVEQLAPKGKQTVILDVGAGMYPKSSIRLAQSFDNISVLDKQFILSKDSMKSMNVTALETMFDVNTQITEYDFIVGRRPCSAIENIVKLSTENQKPYFIELCNCSLPKNPDPLIYSDWGWKYILPKIDPDIQFTNVYAYNLGSRNEYARNMIEKYAPTETVSEKRYTKKTANNHVNSEEVLS